MLNVGELLNTNGTVFKETLGAVCESYSSIKGAVGEGVERCKERVLHQEKLSHEAQNSMLEILVRIGPNVLNYKHFLYIFFYDIKAEFLISV